MNKLLREPFLHFALIGALLFVLYGLFGGGEEDGGNTQIVVTPERVENLAALFRHTWQREPTPEEVRELVDAYVREEVFYREGLAMGLDRDDAMIRKRIESKMEAVAAPQDLPEPSEEELLDFRETHPEQFGVSHRYSFRQVFIDPNRQTGGADSMAGATLMALQAGAGSEDWTALSDPTPLPGSLDNASYASIADSFGGEFADGLVRSTTDLWFGPLRSSHGLHLVQITEKDPQPAPPMEDIRELVLRSWHEAQRREAATELFNELRGKYDIVIAPDALPAGDTTP